MIEVWQDAEVPVEYHAPELHFQNWGKVGFFANLIQTLSPLIIIIVSYLFVVLSYYVAPDKLLIKETPSVYPPFYYLAVGNLKNKKPNSQYTGVTSFLYSNFPQFTEGFINSYTVGGRCMSAVTDSGYLDVQIELPYNKSEDEELKQLTILLPLTINFPKIEHLNVHTMVHYQITQNSIKDVHVVGRFLFDQQRVLKSDEEYGKDQMLNVLREKLSTNDKTAFDIDYILQKFSDSPFTSKIVTILEEVTSPENAPANDPKYITVHFEIRIPEIFAEIRAPFWNMFKVTYVQLFYWFWLVYFVWNRFIRTGFVYGIIPATVRNVLKPAKKKMD